MLIATLLGAASLAAGFGGALALWQRSLRRPPPPPHPMEGEPAPYRAPVVPPSARDVETGGYPTPPSFDD